MLVVAHSQVPHWWCQSQFTSSLSWPRAWALPLGFTRPPLFPIPFDILILLTLHLLLLMGVEDGSYGP